jgi:nitrogen-specific signal transduction histidine kinase
MGSVLINEIYSDKLLLYNDINPSLAKMHEKSDKLSLIKLNIIRHTSFFFWS